MIQPARVVQAPPRRKTQRRIAAATWRKMTPAQKEARARNFVNQTWNATSGLYGRAGQPAPAFSFTSEGTNQTTPEGEVKFSPALIDWLAKPKILDYGGKSRAEARQTVMHEFAHANQNRELRANPNTNYNEEAAELFAGYWAHKLFGSRGMPKRGPIPYANRPAASRELAAAYGPGYWRRRQFLP